MKKYLNIKLASSLMLVSFLLITGCVIDDADDRPTEFTPKLGTANIVFLNAITEVVASETEIDIYVDETKILEKVSFGQFENYLPYRFPQGSLFRAVTSGESPNFTSKGGANNNWAFETAADLLPMDHNGTLQGQLKDGGNYTFVAYGSLMEGEIVGIDLAEDDLSAPSSGAKVRFVNASLDSYLGSETTDFLIAGVNVGTSKYHTSTAITDFVEVAGGSVTLESWDLGDLDDLEDDKMLFSAGVELPAGGIHTVLFMGDSFSPDAGEGLQYKVFTHN